MMIHANTVHTASSPSREQEYLAGWQRARAELDNFRKRLDQEQSQQQLRLRQEVIVPLLGLADSFQTMVSHLPSDLANHAWAVGVVHVARQIKQILREYGVEPIEAVGDQFDPNKHEAVSKVSQLGATSGCVVEVLQTGYVLGDRVIRPAKVRIAK